jgi:hypothetical protein
MEWLNVRTAIELAIFFFLLIGPGITQAICGEYFIYKDPKDVLVISNQKPPPGSTIIKQHNFPDFADADAPPLKDGNDNQPNRDTNSSKPRPNK